MTFKWKYSKSVKRSEHLNHELFLYDTEKRNNKKTKPQNNYHNSHHQQRFKKVTEQTVNATTKGAHKNKQATSCLKINQRCHANSEITILEHQKISECRGVSAPPEN